jgi:hypothetical protein
MKVNVNYCSRKHYDWTNIVQWVWMFKKKKYTKGFIMRIFGVYLNVREDNATQKLIEYSKKIKESNVNGTK